MKISEIEFRSHLKYLKKHNHVVALGEIIEAYQTGKKLPPNSVAITIDDGYSDAYDVAFPILKEFNFPATLFAITDFVEGNIWLWTDKMRYVLQSTSQNKLRVEFENYDTIVADIAGHEQRIKLANKINSTLKKLPDEEKESKILEIAKLLSVEIPLAPTLEYKAINWEMACEMDANKLRIESHTVTHPILTKIDEARLSIELKDSKETLENKLGREVGQFCYPNGAYDEKVWKAVENAGYKCAVTTVYGYCEKAENRFLLK